MQYLGCLLVIVTPGVTALILEELFSRKNPGPSRSSWVLFVGNVCLVNIIIAVYKYLGGWGDWLFADSLNQIQNVAKYGILSILLAALIFTVRNFKVVKKIIEEHFKETATQEIAVTEQTAAENSSELVNAQYSITGKREKLFYFFFTTFAALYSLVFWTQGNLNVWDFNTGTIAFSYKYGFISRSFMGTVIQLIATLLNIEVTSNVIRLISLISILSVYFSFIIFCYYSCVCIEKKYNREVSHFLLFACVTFMAGAGFSTFAVDLGRTDVYLIMLTFLASWLIAKEKHVFLCIPIAVICVLIHEGYVMMYAPVLFVPLLYRFLESYVNKEKKKELKYACTFFGAVILVCSLFFYFYFFARPTDGLLHINVINDSLKIIENPTDDFYNVINAIVGQLFGNRWTYAGSEIIQIRAKYMIPTLVELSPFIIILALIWKKVWITAKEQQKHFLYRIFYFLVPFGFITIIPLFIMHIDYWRWYYQICFYELFSLLNLCACGDELVIDSCRKCCLDILTRWKHFPFLLLLYAVILGPFREQGFFINERLSAFIKSVLMIVTMR